MVQMLSNQINFFIHLENVLYKRKLDNSHHVYAVKNVEGIYYELKSREEGDSKKVSEFIYRSIKSFKKK